MILPEDIQFLEKGYVDKIYTPEDGRLFGLDGMIQDVLNRCIIKDQRNEKDFLEVISLQNHRVIAKELSLIENNQKEYTKKDSHTVVIGITGQEKLSRLFEVALKNQNIFYELMETVKFCSLGEITQTLYQVGGKYRRNM